MNELREDKLRPVYHQFANKVHPITRNSAMLLKDKRLFDVPATGTSSEVKLRYYEQCRSWFFSIGSSGYFAELYTKSAVDVIPDNLTKPEGTPKPWPRQEQWGMRVWHDRWAGLFNENKELGIGKKTKWQPTEAQFFPSEDCLDYVDMEGTEAEVGAGFEALLRAMKTVEDVAMGGIEKREKR